MIFKRFYDDNLAQASYLIASERTREAIVVDPNADIGIYTRAAGADRLRIAHVTETHIHADFLSGARELAEATGATLHLSGEGGEFGYTSQALRGAKALRNGSHIDIGDLRITARHTPGHTPEHLAFLVSDLARGEEPVGALTGDFIFVGDVGRPDLLEKAAGVSGTMENSARQLFKSIARFKEMPDHLQLWPGHGAGSACGKSLGAMPQSTLGYEKLFNWALAEMPEDVFVEKVLEDQPVPPRYFATMKRLNRTMEKPPKGRQPKRLTFADLETALAQKHVVVDTRADEKFAAGHIPGTLNIPLGKSFLNWTGALVHADRNLYLIIESESDDAIGTVLGDLCKIGMMNVAGYFGSDVVHEWQSHHGEVEQVAQMDVTALKSKKNGDVQIIDVRSPEEWSHGHLPGAQHIPLAALPDRLNEIDPSRPVVVQCRGGGRSAIASSLLMARGITNVSNLNGGYDEWVAQRLPTETVSRPENAKR
ncbi:MAG TPA: rhodanese-like domain-containing protein [Gemmatimonadaceae bacterium]|nr:rhodanese-like domain-containing protein [Gemmatimonadaceae bacterium]